MSTLRPSTTDEERYRTGAVSDEVYQCTADYFRQVSGIFENMPEKVQKASSELLSSDQRTSAALTKIEDMLRDPVEVEESGNKNEIGENSVDENGEAGHKLGTTLDINRIKYLVNEIVEESAIVSQVNESLIEQLQEDEQTAELYRTNMMREWVIGHEAYETSDSSDSDDEQPPSQSVEFSNRRMSLGDNEFKPKHNLLNSNEPSTTDRPALISCRPPIIDKDMQSDTGQRQLKLVKPKHLNLHPTNQTSTDNNQSQNQSPSQAFKNLNKTVQNQNTTKIITAKNVVGYPHSNFIRNNDSLNNKKYDQQSINATKNPEKLNLPSQNNSPRKNVVPTQKTSSLPIDTISNSTTIRNKSLTTSSTLHASFNENIQQPSTSSTTQEIKNKKVKRKLLVTKDQQMREKRKRESLNEVRQQNIEDKLGKIARNLHTNVNYDKSAEEKRSRVDDFAEGDDDEEEDDEENVVDGDGGDEDLRNDRNDVSDDDSGLKSDKTGKVMERVAKESSKGKCEKEKVKEPEKLKETSKNKAEKDKFKTSSLAKIDKMVKPEKNVKPDKVMKQIKQEKIGKQDKLMKPEKLIKQEKSDKLVKQEKLVKQAGSKQDVSRKSSNATSKVVKKSKNAKIAENGNSKSSGGDGEDDSGMNDEAKYCSCQNISYGNMIACDNDDCELEWFHFGCVGLSNKPKGKWYCPTCKDKVKT